MCEVLADAAYYEAKIAHLEKELAEAKADNVAFAAFIYLCGGALVLPVRLLDEMPEQFFLCSELNAEGNRHYSIEAIEKGVG